MMKSEMAIKACGGIYGKWVQGTGAPGGNDCSFEMELGALNKTMKDLINCYKRQQIKIACLVFSNIV